MATLKKCNSEPVLVSKQHFIPKEQLVFSDTDKISGPDLGYGVVFKGSYQGKKVAIKVIKIEIEFNKLTNNNVIMLNQIEHSMALSHENFLPYLGWSHDESFAYIVSPFIEKGSLYTLLSSEVLTSDRKVKIAEDIIRGLLYLHSNDVIHRDLKASNIMIDNMYTALVYDLGIAKLVREKEKSLPIVPRPSLDITRVSMDGPSHQRVNTGDLLSLPQNGSDHGSIDDILYPFMPPEMIVSDKYTKEGDIYSFGCILFELLTGMHPFQHEISTGKITGSDIWTLKERGIKPMIPAQIESAILSDAKLSQLLSLMHKCMDQDFKKRPNCFSILSKIRAITSEAVVHVSSKLASNHYASLSLALQVRACLSPASKVSIFIEPGTYVETEDIELNKPHTYIFGTVGSVIQGSILTIASDHVEIDGVTFGTNQDFHLNIAYCSPTVKRCCIHGSMMLFGDENTQPKVFYNTLTNASMITNLMQHGEFKHNQFKTPKLVTKKRTSSTTVAHNSIAAIDTHDAKCIAHAFENKDVQVLDLSDHQITDDCAKYISMSLEKVTKIAKLDFSLNNITDVGAGYIANALKKMHNIDHLDLSDNDIGSRGAKHITEALLSNKVMRKLTFSYNDIGKKAGKYFARLLQENTHLLQIDISYNGIGDAAVKELMVAMKQNVTLAQLIVGKNELSQDVKSEIDKFNQDAGSERIVH